MTRWDIFLPGKATSIDEFKGTLFSLKTNKCPTVK